MGGVLAEYAAEGVATCAFGDLFLEDIRAYRVAKLAGSGIEPVFPLWLKPTGALARDMIAGGLETYLSTVDLKKLPTRFAGRKFDETLLADFPPGVDPCGENGEFHSCVVAGPMFSRRIAIRVGETVERDGFAFADIIPSS
jgi:diphthamide synthase (EF-2-diphthine--ammonia ligase)